MLEQALNSYLSLDPESAKRIKKLEGKIITIELAVVNYSFQLSIHHGKIKLSPGKELEADITIRGTPLNLFSLAVSSNKKVHLLSEAVVIEGNAELGQQIIDLFEELDIDWEEYLSQVIGDIPANQISRFTQTFLAWGKQAKASMLQNLNDYVHEEKPWFPPKEALEDFYRDVDELRLDLDRLEARLKSLL